MIKYYESQGRDSIVLAPKKLEYNWKQYLKRHESILEEDKFEYDVKFHTDLNEDRLYDMMEYLTNRKPN